MTDSTKTNQKLADEIHFGIRQADFSFKKNPATIFVALCTALVSSHKSSFYIPRGRVLHAKRVRRIFALMLSEVDDAIEAVQKRGRGKTKDDAVISLKDWKSKLPALLALEGLVKPFLNGVPVVHFYVKNSAHGVHLESPKQAAWRMARTLVEKIRKGEIGEHIADGIALKTFKHLKSAGLFTKAEAAAFVVAARNSAKPIPVMKGAAKKPVKAHSPKPTQAKKAPKQHIEPLKETLADKLKAAMAKTEATEAPTEEPVVETSVPAPAPVQAAP